MSQYLLWRKQDYFIEISQCAVVFGLLAARDMPDAVLPSAMNQTMGRRF
jgi:hypothetical protein